MHDARVEGLFRDFHAVLSWQRELRDSRDSYKLKYDAFQAELDESDKVPAALEAQRLDLLKTIREEYAREPSELKRRSIEALEVILFAEREKEAALPQPGTGVETPPPQPQEPALSPIQERIGKARKDLQALLKDIDEGRVR